MADHDDEEDDTRPMLSTQQQQVDNGAVVRLMVRPPDTASVCPITGVCCRGGQSKAARESVAADLVELRTAPEDHCAAFAADLWQREGGGGRHIDRYWFRLVDIATGSTLFAARFAAGTWEYRGNEDVHGNRVRVAFSDGGRVEATVPKSMLPRTFRDRERCR